MTYSVEFAALAAKELASLDRKTRERIAGTIELLAIDPRPKGAHLLSGGEGGRWRVRVGDYRVVYTIEDQRLIVLILRIAHRRDVYKH